jgi:signal transduction histidine kinase
MTLATARVYQSPMDQNDLASPIVDGTAALKSTEETLNETKAVLEFTLQAAQIGDWDLDLIHDTSRRSLRHDQCFGYQTPIPDADWGIAVFIQHVHPEDRSRVESSLRLAVKESKDWGAEFRVVWPDKSIHWLAARGSIYRTSEGTATRMLGIVMEISDRRRAEEARMASEQLARGQVEALKRTLDALAMESSPDRLVDHILCTITEQLGAHSSSVWRRDEASGLIGFELAYEDGKVVTTADPRFVGMDLWLPMEDFWPWPEVFRVGKPSVIEDIREVPPFPLRDRLLPLGIITVLLVPMFILGRLEGAIGLRFTRKRTFRAEEVELAQALANQAMLTMRLTRLSAESREAAVLAERNRMARDIHDTLAQGFTGVIVQLEAAGDAKSKGLEDEADEHVSRAALLARESLNEARRSVRALRPQELEDKSLCEALETLIHKMTAGTTVRAELVVQGTAQDLPPNWEENLLRAGQELLTNVLRHAHARKFKAQIEFASDAVRLSLADDGVGFDPAARHDGFGLLGVKERVKAMGGQFSIRSVSGEGTDIVITLPLVSPS